ncbi:2-phospho-L-lactate transferase [anaerobic digester metagenome]
MITVLSGGTGTPKLLRGLRRLLPDPDLAVVVNTAEDCWLYGNHLSPDIDTVLYLFADLLDTATWWGIRGDTFTTHEMTKQLGVDAFIAVGDRDRAVHIRRAELLREGRTLTAATTDLAAALGVDARVLPMTDAPYTTHVQTPEGLLHFQEYWVRHHGALPITDVIRLPPGRPPATDAVIAALGEAEAVVIGPSNPVTSIGPILECRGVVEALKKAFVVAVSPFLGTEPISGPAGVLMTAVGQEPSSLGTFRLYEEFVDRFVQDVRDPVEVPGAVRADTLMVDMEHSESLAGVILDLVHDR